MGMSGGGAYLPGDPPPSTGQVINQPTIAFTASSVTATGATGGAGTALSIVTPVLAVVTGTSGMGVDLVTGAAVAGAYYVIKNNTTGVLNVYAVGGTINGTTGTTAFGLTATGNKMAFAFCVTAGAWQIAGNT